MEPIGETPIEMEDHILRVWCLYMSVQTVKQAAFLMRHDYHNSDCYRTYLKQSQEVLKEKKKKLIEVIKRTTLAHQYESPLHEHPSG